MSPGGLVRNVHLDRTSSQRRFVEEDSHESEGVGASGSDGAGGEAGFEAERCRRGAAVELSTEKEGVEALSRGGPRGAEAWHRKPALQSGEAGEGTAGG